MDQTIALSMSCYPHTHNTMFSDARKLEVDKEMWRYQSDRAHRLREQLKDLQEYVTCMVRVNTNITRSDQDFISAFDTAKKDMIAHELFFFEMKQKDALKEREDMKAAVQREVANELEKRLNDCKLKDKEIEELKAANARLAKENLMLKTTQSKRPNMTTDEILQTTVRLMV